MTTADSEPNVCGSSVPTPYIGFASLRFVTKGFSETTRQATADGTAIRSPALQSHFRYPPNTPPSFCGPWGFCPCVSRTVMEKGVCERLVCVRSPTLLTDSVLPFWHFLFCESVRCIPPGQLPSCPFEPVENQSLTRLETFGVPFGLSLCSSLL